MKRIVSALIVAALLTSLAGCSSSEILTGTAKGFDGTMTVTVTREGDKITDVKVDAPKETAGIGDKAAAELPAKIVEANSTDVDVYKRQVHCGCDHSGEAVPQTGAGKGRSGCPEGPESINRDVYKRQPL